jgi:hypothetical protein
MGWERWPLHCIGKKLLWPWYSPTRNELPRWAAIGKYSAGWHYIYHHAARTCRGSCRAATANMGSLRFNLVASPAYRDGISLAKLQYAEESRHVTMIMKSLPLSLASGFISIVCWGTMLQAGKSRVLFPMRSPEFLIDLILPAAQCAWGRLSL